MAFVFPPFFLRLLGASAAAERRKQSTKVVLEVNSGISRALMATHGEGKGQNP